MPGSAAGSRSRTTAARANARPAASTVVSGRSTISGTADKAHRARLPGEGRRQRRDRVRRRAGDRRSAPASSPASRRSRPTSSRSSSRSTRPIDYPAGPVSEREVLRLPGARPQPDGAVRRHRAHPASSSSTSAAIRAAWSRRRSARRSGPAIACRCADRSAARSCARATARWCWSAAAPAGRRSGRSPPRRGASSAIATSS